MQETANEQNSDHKIRKGDKGIKTINMGGSDTCKVTLLIKKIGRHKVTAHITASTRETTTHEVGQKIKVDPDYFSRNFTLLTKH